MTVLVKCFAIARDLAGFSERGMVVSDHATVADALALLTAAAPALLPHAERMAVAVNLEYVDRTHLLKEGDELALIPPVSGGAT